MKRITRFVFGSKQQMPKQPVVEVVKSSKMSIEETIRRYEQLYAK